VVTCWDCLRTLPYDCICPVSDKTKSLRWAEKTIREVELFTAILEGFKPTIRVNGKNCITKTEITDVGGIEIYVKADIKKSDEVNVVLLDKNGNPLFRRHYSKDETVNVSSITLSWRIGTLKERK